MSNIVLSVLAIGATSATLLTHKWLAKQHAKYRASRFSHGYKFAKVILLSGEITPHELLAQASNPFDIDEFDRGIRQAVLDHNTQVAN